MQPPARSVFIAFFEICHEGIEKKEHFSTHNAEMHGVGKRVHNYALAKIKSKVIALKPLSDLVKWA